MAKSRSARLFEIGWFILKNWPWFASTGMGALMAWLASVSPLFPKYAPFSYVAVFLLTAAVVMGAIALCALAAERWAKRGFWVHVQEPTRTVNPLDTTFTGVRISLVDIAEPDVRVIRGKTFVNCELVGRRLPYLYNGCHFYPRIGLSGCDLMAIPGREGQRGPALGNTVLVTDCIFQNCKFYYQTMLVYEHDAHVMNAASGNALPWLVPPRSAEN